MIKNYFLIALRSMMKNRLFILINVTGMGIAIGCCIVAYFAFEYDASFDAIHKNGETIYRISAIREFQNQLTRSGFAPMPLGELTRRTFSDINGSTRFRNSWSNFKLQND